MVQYGTMSEVSSHDTNGRCRYTMLLARPVAGLKDLLAKIDRIGSIEVDNQRVIFEYDSAQEDAASLLAELIARKLPVASFAPNARAGTGKFVRGWTISAPGRETMALVPSGNVFTLTPVKKPPKPA